MKLQLLKEPRELKPWVNVDATVAKFGYDPRWFKPNSFRTVVCKCTGCDQLRDKQLRDAELHLLCLQCSNQKNANTNLSVRSRKVKATWAKNGHPRTGVKHTEEAKKKIRENRKPYSMPDWRRREFSIRFSGMGNPFYGKKHKPESLRRGKNSPAYGKSPRHSFKVWYERKDGIRVCFRSTWEARVAAYLDSRGIEWQYESKIFPVQYEWQGKFKQSTYRADFWLPVTDSFIEVKGLWRPEYLAKYEALRNQHNIKIEVWDRTVLKERGIYTGRGKAK